MSRRDKTAIDLNQALFQLTDIVGHFLLLFQFPVIWDPCIVFECTADNIRLLYLKKVLEGFLHIAGRHLVQNKVCCSLYTSSAGQVEGTTSLMLFSYHLQCKDYYFTVYLVMWAQM